MTRGRRRSLVVAWAAVGLMCIAGFALAPSRSGAIGDTTPPQLVSLTLSRFFGRHVERPGRHHRRRAHHRRHRTLDRWSRSADAHRSHRSRRPATSDRIHLPSAARRGQRRRRHVPDDDHDARPLRARRVERHGHAGRQHRQHRDDHVVDRHANRRRRHESAAAHVTLSHARVHRHLGRARLADGCCATSPTTSPACLTASECPRAKSSSVDRRAPTTYVPRSTRAVASAQIRSMRRTWSR